MKRIKKEQKNFHGGFIMVYLDDEGCSKDPKYVEKWFRGALKECLGTVERFLVYHDYLKLYPEMRDMVERVFDEYYPDRWK